MHAREQNAFMNRHRAQHLAIELGLCEGKNVPKTVWNVLGPGFATAKERAQALALEPDLSRSPEFCKVLYSTI